MCRIIKNVQQKRTRMDGDETKTYLLFRSKYRKSCVCVMFEE